MDTYKRPGMPTESDAALHRRLVGLPPEETGAGLSLPNEKPRRSVMQEWAQEVSYMQQSVLMGIVRGPDNVEKYHAVKPILRWYRRCLLLSALDGEVLTNPTDRRGGSFTGPSYDFHGDHLTARWEGPMDVCFDKFMATMDAMPIHFYTHMMHAIEIMGYHHSNPRIALWWNKNYIRMVHALHLYPESKDQLDVRLGDTVEGWMARSDPAITK